MVLLRIFDSYIQAYKHSTMIKRLNSIEKFGIYKDFKWNRNNDLQDFNDKNIIYGWNYSGKTTLSRIFECLKQKKLLSDFVDAKLSIKTETSEITESNIISYPRHVFVFNKDYIDDNLSFNDTKFGEPIAFDVGDNTNIRNEIEDIELKLKKVELRESNHQPTISDFEDFEKSKFTNISKSIKLQVFNNTENFDKGSFKSILKIIKDAKTAKEKIITDKKKIQELNLSSKANDDLDYLHIYDFKFKYQQLYNKTIEILNQQPKQDVVIDILNNNSLLFNWVEDGLTYKENKEYCSFCGNKITKERIELLNNFFSNESQKLRSEIESLKEQINSEKKLLDNIFIKYSKNDILKNLVEDYNLNYLELQNVIKLYSKALSDFVISLDEKLTGNIFNKLSYNKKKFNIIALYRKIVIVNAIIKKHNDFKVNFLEERNKSRNELKEHLVSQFLIEEKYFEKLELYSNSTNWLSIYKRLEEKLNNLKSTKENSLKTITKGKDILNEHIQKFLNRSDIKIEVTKDDKFILVRNNKQAKFLSEGEKTAIAFSYFLVGYESLGYNNMKEAIVFIDDPISSLDSNHISQVYTLINSFFFRKGIDKSSPNSVMNCFKQLFISTHNFEFFSFLRDSGQLKRKKKVTDADGEKKEIPSCEFFQIRRIDNENSCISPLPKPLSRFKSEYIYLFSLIMEYKKKVDEGGDTFDILIPNALRRFLEIYTLMKIPSEPDSVENRIAELVDDVNNYKTLNHFSHFTTFEKATKHDELLMILPDACNELINLLKKDNSHFESLKKAIK